jgi:putative addiction module component (TIGR02574 family)
MSKTEILEQLPKLDSVELREIRDRIWQIEEEELLSGRAKPSEEEKELLDRELTDYSRDPNAGSSWEEVESRLKQ